MRGFGAIGVAGEPTTLPQPIETGDPAREDLVDLALLTGVKDDWVVRGVKAPVDAAGQLHHPEARADTPSCPAHPIHQEPTDLLCHIIQLLT